MTGSRGTGGREQRDREQCKRNMSREQGLGNMDGDREHLDKEEGDRKQDDREQGDRE